MALPIRRATPQPRPKPLRPRRIVPSGIPPNNPTAIQILVGRKWPRVRTLGARLVTPVAPATSTRVVGGRSRTAKPLRARLVTPAGIPPDNPKATLRPGHIWPRVRINASRRVIPVSIVAAVAQPATAALKGHAWPTVRRLSLQSRLILGASLPGPQPASTNLIGGRSRTAKAGRPRLVTPAGIPPTNPASSVPMRGVGRPVAKRVRPQLTTVPLPVVAGVPATRALHGLRWRPVLNNRSRLVAPAPLAGPQAPGIFVLHGAKWRPILNNHSRRILPVSAISAFIHFPLPKGLSVTMAQGSPKALPKGVSTGPVEGAVKPLPKGTSSNPAQGNQ